MREAIIFYKLSLQFISLNWPHESYDYQMANWSKFWNSFFLNFQYIEALLNFI